MESAVRTMLGTLRLDERLEWKTYHYSWGKKTSNGMVMFVGEKRKISAKLQVFMSVVKKERQTSAVVERYCEIWHEPLGFETGRCIWQGLVAFSDWTWLEQVEAEILPFKESAGRTGEKDDIICLYSLWHRFVWITQFSTQSCLWLCKVTQLSMSGWFI